MRVIAGAALILSLAACSKSEPPPDTSPAPVKEVGRSLSPDKAQPSGHSSLAQPIEDKKAPPPPEPTAPVTAVASEEILRQGAEIFAKTCATCHMADGSGVPYLQPSIKGSAWISAPDPQLLLSLILRGSAILGEAAKAYDNDMAPQDHLTDAEVAAVATYVRQRFATAPMAEAVTPAQVAVARSRPGLP